MKKILFLLLLFFSCFALHAQTGNDTTKYTYYKFNYGEKFNRAWALNVLDIPNDTIFSKYGVSKKGTNFYVGNGTKWTLVNGVATNIYNSNGTITDDRHVSGPIAIGAPTKTLFFDSLLNIYFNQVGLGNGVILYGKSGSSTLDVGQNEISETVFNNAVSNVSFNQYLGDSTHLRVYNFGSDTSYITIAPTSITFFQQSGVYKFRNLVQANDTSTYKPLAATSAGIVKRMDGWAGSGGGGGVAVDAVQSYTTGTTLTQTTGDNIIQLNPASVQATLTITTATSANWHNSNDLYIVAGGTVTSGNPVITTLAVAAGSGLTLVQAITPTTINAGEVIRYHKIGTLIYRMN